MIERITRIKSLLLLGCQRSKEGHPEVASELMELIGAELAHIEPEDLDINLRVMADETAPQVESAFVEDEDEPETPEEAAEHHRHFYSILDEVLSEA